MYVCVTCLHHLQQLGVGESVLAPDDGHRLGASVSVAVPSGRGHPGRRQQGSAAYTSRLLRFNYTAAKVSG